MVKNNRSIYFILSIMLSMNAEASSTDDYSSSEEDHHIPPVAGGAAAAVLALHGTTQSDLDHIGFLNSAHLKEPHNTETVTLRSAFNWARDALARSQNNLSDIPYALGLINTTLRGNFVTCFSDDLERQGALYRAARSLGAMRSLSPRPAFLATDADGLRKLKKSSLQFDIFHFEDILAHHESKSTTDADPGRRTRWLNHYWRKVNEANRNNRSRETSYNHTLLAKLINDYGFRPTSMTALEALEFASRATLFRDPAERSGPLLVNRDRQALPQPSVLSGTSHFFKAEQRRIRRELARQIVLERAAAPAGANSDSTSYDDERGDIQGRVSAASAGATSDSTSYDAERDDIQGRVSAAPAGVTSDLTSYDAERDDVLGSRAATDPTGAVVMQEWGGEALDELQSIADMILTQTSELAPTSVFSRYIELGIPKTLPEIQMGLGLLEARRIADNEARSLRKRRFGDLEGEEASASESAAPSHDVAGAAGLEMPSSIKRARASVAPEGEEGEADEAVIDYASDSDGGPESDEDSSDGSAPSEDEAVAQQSAPLQSINQDVLITATLQERDRYTTHHGTRLSTIIRKYRESTGDIETSDEALSEQINAYLSISK